MAMKKLLVLASAIFAFASPADAQMAPVKLGINKIGAMTSVWVATQAGIFIKHGLDVKVIEIPLTEQTIPLLQAKTIDIILQIPGTAMVAKEAGFDLVLIGQNETAGTTPPVSNAIMVPVNSPIRSVAELRGKRISASSSRGQGPSAFKELLQRYGVTREQVQVTVAPFSSSTDLLRTGQIDAAVTLDPYSTQIRKSGFGRTLSWYFVETMPDMPIGSWWALRSWAQEHPKEAAAFDAAIREAHAYLFADPERARKAVSDYTGLDPDLVKDMPLNSWKGEVDRTAWQAVADMMFRQGELTQHHDVSEYLLKK
jgi:NitT/TauT family transport system substrate-binding protein